MAVVKADGYGHGAVTVARAAVAAGAGVARDDERRRGLRVARAARLAVPILTWLHPSGIDAEAAAAGRVDVAVGSVDELGALLAHAAVDGAGPSPRGHRDVPGRLPPRAVGRTDRSRSAWSTGCGGSTSWVSWGIFRWPTGPTRRRTRRRSLRMREAQQAVRAAGLGAPLAHLAATSGTADRPGDPLRHGPRRGGAGRHRSRPRPWRLHGASRLTAPIVHTAAVAAGTPVGYAGTYVTDRATHLSVLPVGYADGIPRELVAQAGVEICGRRVPGRRTGLDGPDRDRHRCRVLPGRHDRDRVRPGRGRDADHPGLGPLGRDHPAHHRHRHRAARAAGASHDPASRGHRRRRERRARRLPGHRRRGRGGAALPAGSTSTS